MSGGAPSGAPVIPGQIRVRGVSRHFKVLHDKSLTLKETVLRRRRVVATEFQALRGVDLDVAPGEAVGIVGRNGSGKSTLLKILAGILSPHDGTVELGGTVTSMLELGSGFHPDFTGRENVLMNGAIHGLTEEEIESRLDEIVEFSELAEFIDNPVRTYSSGMQMRLGYAVAAHLRPDVLLLDEVLSVGDEAFQRKCIAHIFDYRRHGGTLVFVSHDPGQVERVCNRAVLMHQGEIVDEGPPGEVLADYRRLLVSTGAGASSGDVHEHGDDTLPEPESVHEPDLVLSGYRLLGPGGVTDRVMSDDPIAVEIDLVAEGGLGSVQVTADVVSDEGPILSESTSQFPVDDGEVTTLRLDLPDLGLNTGGFSVSFSLTKGDGTPLEHREQVLPFDVFPRESGRSLLATTGTWSATSAPGAPASVEPAATPTGPRRALGDGFRVRGREGQVLVVAGADPDFVHGGGVAVYDGRRLEVVDRVSTVGLEWTADGALARLLLPGPPSSGALELLKITPRGLDEYRRLEGIGEITGSATSDGRLVVSASGCAFWIAPDGAVVRQEPGGLLADDAVVRVVGQGPTGPLAVVTSQESTWLADLSSGRRIGPADERATAVVASDSASILAQPSVDLLVVHSSDSEPRREIACPFPGSLVSAGDLVAVGQDPVDPATSVAASLMLLDPEVLQPVASVQLPFARVSAMAFVPKDVVSGLRAAALDLHGIFSAGADRHDGWIEPGIGHPGESGEAARQHPVQSR